MPGIACTQEHENKKREAQSIFKKGRLSYNGCRSLFVHAHTSYTTKSTVLSEFSISPYPFRF
jgi:hypothetical protein